MKPLLLTAFVLVFFHPLFGQEKLSKDTLYLKSGNSIIGDIIYQTKESITIEVGYPRDSKINQVQTSDIHHIGNAGSNAKAKESTGLSKRDPVIEAGKELSLFRRNYYIGYTVTVGGALLSTIGITQLDKAGGDENSPETGKTLVIVGGLVTLFGILSTLESFSHIGKAGELLQNKVKLTSGYDGRGIGICYRF